MFSTTLAWIGIVMVIVSMIITMSIIFFGLPKYRQIMIEKNPPKTFTAMGCITAATGWISYILYFVLLVLNFKIEVLLAVILFFGAIGIQMILDIKKEQNECPEDKEKVAQIAEKISFGNRLLTPFLLGTMNGALRLLPFILFLILK
ncbi:MAG TPA: hypothetical protein VLH94_02980 [Spirochaetia bacterium]|nr:hypothetical protein [Spirochaetia bacterium]